MKRLNTYKIGPYHVTIWQCALGDYYFSQHGTVKTRFQSERYSIDRFGCGCEGFMTRYRGNIDETVWVDPAGNLRDDKIDNI